MRQLSDLINTNETAWPLVQEWFAESKNTIEILPVDRKRGEHTLLQLQVTTRSPMGALALETGGVLFDHGWLRFWGAGNTRMLGNLLSWNGLENQTEKSRIPGALLVAHDVLGGFFSINGGAFPKKVGSIYYLAPDTLEWTPISESYSAFLAWAATGDIHNLYEDLRWPGWENEVSKLTGDQGFSIYPPLWTATGGDISTRSRHAVPMVEIWALQNATADQLRNPR